MSFIGWINLSANEELLTKWHTPGGLDRIFGVKFAVILAHSGGASGGPFYRMLVIT